ncbi:MAG TPA: PKD domain-containing protein [Acidimicrobiales bacterium]|nr:PKD domain-containing protein [Acidimicrobiales bacterium]
MSAALTVTLTVADRPQPSGAQGTAWTAFAVAPSTFAPNGAVVPFAISSVAPIGSPGTAGAPIALTDAIARPNSVAITPDASTAFVLTNSGATAITAGTAHPISFDPQPNPEITPYGIAASPTDTTAWVATYYCLTVPGCFTALVQISPTSASYIRRIQLPSTFVTAGPLAITPDGKTAYAVDTTGWVYPVDLAGGTVGTRIPVGPNATAIAVTPDGTRVYAVASNGNASGTVTPILIPGNTTLSPLVLSLGRLPTSIAINPDGRTAYVADPGDTNLIAIDITKQPPQSLGSISVGTNPMAIAITPDGGTAYVPTGRCWVQPIRLADQALLTRINLSAPCPLALAITPDQAPTAAFNVTPGLAGHASGFDASPSSVPNGSIARYDWVFGDGGTTSTTTPTTSHVYGAAGTYTAALTVTDTAGTSTTKVFTGQTMSRNGGPSAQRSRAFVVAAPVTTTPPTTGTTATTSTTSTTLPVTTTLPGTPKLTLVPTVGPPGTVVSVTGSGFAHNVDVALAWQPGVGAVTAHTDGAGNLVSTILVIPRDLLGPRILRANTSPAAQADFTVEPATVEPGGSDVLVLFRR